MKKLFLLAAMVCSMNALVATNNHAPREESSSSNKRQRRGLLDKWFKRASQPNKEGVSCAMNGLLDGSAAAVDAFYKAASNYDIANKNNPFFIVFTNTQKQNRSIFETAKKAYNDAQDKFNAWIVSVDKKPGEVHKALMGIGKIIIDLNIKNSQAKEKKNELELCIKRARAIEFQLMKIKKIA